MWAGTRDSIYMDHRHISLRSIQMGPEMSPSLSQSTWRKATWEIMESEHIDFPAADPGGGPDEELQRKCNHLILLLPGPAMPAAQLT